MKNKSGSNSTDYTDDSFKVGEEDCIYVYIRGVSDVRYADVTVEKVIDDFVVVSCL